MALIILCNVFILLKLVYILLCSFCHFIIKLLYTQTSNLTNKITPGSETQATNPRLSPKTQPVPYTRALPRVQKNGARDKKELFGIQTALTS